MPWNNPGASGDPTSAIVSIVTVSAVTPTSVAFSASPAHPDAWLAVVGVACSFGDSLRPQAVATAASRQHAATQRMRFMVPPRSTAWSLADRGARGKGCRAYGSDVPAARPRDTKELLLDAAEVLFARDGIDGARIREINELAGQRNPSALHYHFGSRDGLVTAILLRHQSEIDKVIERRLDELEAAGDATVRDVIGTVVDQMVDRLGTASGRNWARIIPHVLPSLSDNLRHGVMEPVTPQTQRVLQLLEERIDELPQVLRRERLVDYAVVLSTLVAERAHQLESDRRPPLDDGRFARHLTDVLVAVVTTPTTDEGRASG